MQGLFIIGNKRSGSTHLMKLLNLHPKIYVTNESDVIWILYNFHNNKKIINYKHDSPAGMKFSLEKAESKLSSNLSVVENFKNYQTHLMNVGFLGMEPLNRINLKYIGDQKPYQNIDPELVPFIVENFPKAKFIHILRHPFDVVTSSMKFGNGTGGYIWKNMEPKEILAKWEMHENWVLNAKQKYNIDVLELRYESLIKNPKKEMIKMFNFLNLDYDDEILNKGYEITKYNLNKIKQYELTDSQKSLLKNYSMKTSFSYIDSHIIPEIYGKMYVFNKTLLRIKKKLSQFKI